MSAPAAPKVLPRAAPRQPSRDPKLLRRGRGHYPRKPLTEWSSAEDILDRIYETPREQGGKLGLRRYRNYVENQTRVIELLRRQMIREQSAAFAMSQPQMIRGLWPELRGKSMDELYNRRQRTLVRYLDDLKAAGFLQWEGEKDAIGAYWRTLFWLLDPDAGEGWRSYTPTTTEAPVTDRETVREAIRTSLPGASPEATPSLFSEDLTSPSGVDYVLQDVVHSSYPFVNSLGARASASDAIKRLVGPPWPTTLEAWRSTSAGAMELEADRRARADALIELAVSAVRDGAPQLPVVRFGFELLSGRPPSLSRHWRQRLAQTLARADRYALDGFGERGAGAAWLLGRMLDCYLSGDTEKVFIVSKSSSWKGRRSPQTLTGWVVALRREVRAWRRHARGLRGRESGSC